MRRPQRKKSQGRGPPEDEEPREGNLKEEEKEGEVERGNQGAAKGPCRPFIAECLVWGDNIAGRKQPMSNSLRG